MNISQLDNLFQQRAVLNFCFISIPTLILKILVANNVIVAPGFTESKDSNGSLMFSLAITILSLITAMTTLKLDANLFDEDFGEYLTAVLNAKLGWVPFYHRL